MQRNEFYLLLDDLLGFDPGTLTGEEVLSDLEEWDSLAIVGFIALIDEEFSIAVPPTRLRECRMVSDLGDLAGL